MAIELWKNMECLLGLHLKKIDTSHFIARNSVWILKLTNKYNIIILNSVRQHNHFITQGNYKATCFDYRLVILRPILSIVSQDAMHTLGYFFGVTGSLPLPSRLKTDFSTCLEVFIIHVVWLLLYNDVSSKFYFTFQSLNVSFSPSSSVFFRHYHSFDGPRSSPC